MRFPILLLLTTFSCTAANAQPCGVEALQSDAKPYTLDGENFAFTVQKTPEGEEYGYFVSGSRWLSEPDGTTVVYVCWENYDSTLAREHKLVRDAVTNTWQRHSKLKFEGWQPCASKSSGIRIFVADDINNGPHTKGYGCHLSGVNRGMVLNFTNKKWKPFGTNTGDLAIISVAVHEFGHGIGFAHEHNRPDKPGECNIPPQGSSVGAVALTRYDKDSVMNYCSANATNNGMLTALDISALQQKYEKP